MGSATRAAADAAALEFFTASSRAETLQDLVDAFAGAARACGFARASCVHIATPGKPVSPRALFGWNITDWAMHYAEARLSRYDPAIQAVFTSTQPFTWAEVEARTTPENKIIFHQARDFGAEDALVVPVHGPLGEMMAVVLVSEHGQVLDPQARLTMQVAATIFATRGLHLAEIEREASPDPNLSRREIQTIYWVNEGKTDWEIGQILGISEDTVAYHLKSIRAKLGVARRAQIPIVAWQRGVLLDERP